MHRSGRGCSIQGMGTTSRYIVIGGGEWGCHHTDRLYWAMDSARLPAAPVTVVDRDASCPVSGKFGHRPGFELEVRDWGAFLLDALASAPEDGELMIVPSPHQPHLFLDWLEAALAEEEARARLGRFAVPPDLDLPFQYAGAGSCLYVSAADWLCPVSCTEPAVCPATRSPRTWEMQTLLEWRHGGGAEALIPIVWKCRHLCAGVSGVGAQELRSAVRRLRQARRGRALVATVSACHGVAAGLEFDLESGGGRDD